MSTRRGDRRALRPRPAAAMGAEAACRARRGRRAARRPAAYPSRRAAPRADGAGAGRARRCTRARAVRPSPTAASAPTSRADMPQAALERPNLGGRVAGEGGPLERLERRSPGPTFGLPSRSPPIHVPKRSGALGQPRPRASSSRAGVPDALLDEPESLPDLVGDARRRDRTSSVCQRIVTSSASALSTPLALGGRQERVVEASSRRRDAGAFEHRPRRRLGRMRREDELHASSAGALRPRSVDTRRSSAERLGERLARRAPLPLVLPHAGALDGAARRC